MPVLLRCVALVASLLASAAHAEDWPQWRGPSRNGHVPPGSRIPQTLNAEPKVLWRILVGEGFASPIVAGGKVFCFDNQAGKETLRALNAADAKEIWRAAVDDTFQD